MSTSTGPASTQVSGVAFGSGVGAYPTTLEGIMAGAIPDGGTA